MLNRDELIATARLNPELVIDQLLSMIFALEKRVQELEALLAKNSRNSDKPPSSDGYDKPAPKSLREKNGLKPGGQPGHPGRSLAMVKNPDLIIPHKLTDCPCGCNGSLITTPVLSIEKRQVFDLPDIHLAVTEHQVEVKQCPRSGQIVIAPFPANVNAPVQYGSHFKAFLVYLRTQQLLPLDRITQIVSDLLGQSISEDTVQASLNTAFDNLAPFEATLTSQLPNVPVLHADETGLRVEGKLHWLHVLSTPLLTWYGVHAKRGTEALNYFGHLMHFSGRLIHDYFKSYLSLACLHGFCNAHLLRELKFLHEEMGQVWAQRMFRLLLTMHRLVERQKQTTDSVTPDQIQPWLRRYRRLLRQGRVENPPLPPPAVRRRGRVAKTKAQNLLDRLNHWETSVLAFLSDPSVPFSNNQAEQDLRMMKVQQKISGTFRTLKGAHQFARIRSYLSTVRKHRRHILTAITNAMNGQPFLPSAAQ